MKVPLLDLRAELAPERPAIDAAIARVLDAGVFIGGPEVEGLERELAAAVGCQAAVGVSSGTDALLATLMALGVGPGHEVVTTPLTFVATASVIARLGARPVFVDVDDTLTLEPAAAAAAITARTAAYVPVHLFGHPAALPSVAVPIVEDAAQSLGGGPVRGRAATVSFFPTKNLGALGDGGAVLTDDGDLAERIALVRGQGARPRYHHLVVGGNFRLDALQAAVLRARLPRLAAATAARRANAAAYRAAFAELVRAGALALPPAHPDHVYHQFVVETPRRDALRAALTAAGVGTEIYYPTPLHLQPCFADLGYAAGSCPRAERACAEALALPIHPALPAAHLEHVARTVIAALR
ncbi:MAG: DegT/DnrJ/EryC1/StrS family aminotransferase [Kofleriaceae bacterium]